MFLISRLGFVWRGNAASLTNVKGIGSAIPGQGWGKDKSTCSLSKLRPKSELAYTPPSEMRSKKFDSSYLVYASINIGLMKYNNT